ncbi:MAG: hypothetical protein FWG50_03000 [Kiritimatiellaeota bacterium]|nr:hypothetical protein [Kiritimatiellota bacterium]
MKKDGRDQLLERVSETGGDVASKAGAPRKPSKPAVLVAPARKRIFPIPGLPIVKIIDMRAVLK